MGHSKVKLEVGLDDCNDSLFVSPFHTPHAGTELVAMCYGDNHIANAQRLNTCWNEHDTLKAKADLLDEMIHSYSQMEGHLGHYIRMFEEQFPRAKSLVVMQAKQYELDEILKKAEAL